MSNPLWPYGLYVALSTSVHRSLKARTLVWAIMPHSRGSSQPRTRTRISYVSCIGRWVLYPSAIWEAHIIVYMCPNSWNYILTMDEIYCMYSFYICIEKCTFVWEAGEKSTIIPSEEYIPILDFRSQHFCGTADFASSYHVSEWNTSWESGFSQ